MTIDLEQYKAKTEQQIDAAVADVYAMRSAFAQEYNDREAQARAFQASGYQGDVPPQVAAYHIPAGLTAQQATDTIIVQADQMHGLIEQLGTLRMKKFAVRQAQTLDDVHQISEPVFAAIKQIKSGL